MKSQAPINLLRECPMDTLIWSLFQVSEQSKIFYCAKVFSLLQHSFQFSNGKDLQNENAERTAHSSPCFPVNTQWYQGRCWCNRKRNYQEKMLHSSNRLQFCALPFVWVPLSMPCSLPHRLLDPISSVVQTTAGPYISDNPGSYKELCSHIRTSDIKAAHGWTPPTAYLGGYYS